MCGGPAGRMVWCVVLCHILSWCVILCLVVSRYSVILCKFGRVDIVRQPSFLATTWLQSLLVLVRPTRLCLGARVWTSFISFPTRLRLGSGSFSASCVRLDFVLVRACGRRSSAFHPSCGSTSVPSCARASNLTLPWCARVDVVHQLSSLVAAWHFVRQYSRDT